MREDLRQDRDTLAKSRFQQAVGEKMAEIYEEHSRDAAKTFAQELLSTPKSPDTPARFQYVEAGRRCGKTEIVASAEEQRREEALADQIRALFCAQLGELSKFPSLAAVVLTNPMTRLLDGVSQADAAVTL